MFVKDEATYRSVAKEFNRTFPERGKLLSHSTVIRIIKRFQETGSVADRDRCERQTSATNKKTLSAVLENVATSPINKQNISTSYS